MRTSFIIISAPGQVKVMAMFMVVINCINKKYTLVIAMYIKLALDIFMTKYRLTKVGRGKKNLSFFYMCLFICKIYQPPILLQGTSGQFSE